MKELILFAIAYLAIYLATYSFVDDLALGFGRKTVSERKRVLVHDIASLTGIVVGGVVLCCFGSSLGCLL